MLLTIICFPPDDLICKELRYKQCLWLFILKSGVLFFTLLLVLFGSMSGRYSVNMSGLNLWQVTNYNATLGLGDSDDPMSCSCFYLISLAFFCSALLSLEEKKGKKQKRKGELQGRLKVEVCKERLKEKARHRKVYVRIEKRDKTLKRVQAMFFLTVKETNSS